MPNRPRRYRSRLKKGSTDLARHVRLDGLLALHLWSVLLAVICVLPARAQTALTRDEQNLVNFGFATQLGSGVYAVSGRTLQIYRLPFSYTLQSNDEHKVGVELTLPVTVGFYDFKLRDVAQATLPNHVDSVSFVPGVTFSFPVLPTWRLEPFLEAGISETGDPQSDANVYAGGLRSLYTFGAQRFAWLLYNDIVYAGLDFRGSAGSDDFTRLRTALTARRPFTRESTADYLLYAMHEYYIDQPHGTVYGPKSGGSSVQYEFGITFGTTPARRVWRVPLPRVGIGYRFGSNIEVFRLVLGSPY
jgi:hypothetical protein